MGWAEVRGVVRGGDFVHTIAKMLRNMGRWASALASMASMGRAKFQKNNGCANGPDCTTYSLGAVTGHWADYCPFTLAHIIVPKPVDSPPPPPH